MKFLLDHLPEHSLSAGGYFKQHPLIIRGWDGTGEPVINFDLVRFNGDDEQRYEAEYPWDECMAHEQFTVPRVFHPEAWQGQKKRYFQCCKTARKPYDLVVTASLIRFKYHFGDDVRISSDGDREDWEEGRKFCLELFGEADLSFLNRREDEEE